MHYKCDRFYCGSVLIKLGYDETTSNMKSKFKEILKRLTFPDLITICCDLHTKGKERWELTQ